MTKEITQEERLDLKNLKEEMQAYNIKLLDYCEAFGIDSKEVMKEYFHDIAIHSNEYKKLKEENQRLKKQLKDYENALKDYADGDFYEAFVNFKHNKFDSLDIIDKKGNVIYTKAQETLKKWEE